MANNIDEIRKEYPNAYKTWQKREEQQLEQLYNAGESTANIANEMGRQPSAIVSRIVDLGLLSNDIPSFHHFIDLKEGTEISHKETIEKMLDLSISQINASKKGSVVISNEVMLQLLKSVSDTLNDPHVGVSNETRMNLTSFLENALKQLPLNK